MQRIIQLSDLHFGAAPVGMAEHLLEAVAQQRPDLVVISGDLTQRARSAEFQEAADFIAQLPCPRLVVPGNHDLAAFRFAERLLYPWQKWKRYISPELEPVVRAPGIVAVGLNTARRMNTHFDWSRGRINQLQIQRIEKELAQSAPDDLKLVVTHHPFVLTEAAKGRGLIGRLNLAWPRFKAAGVDLVLSGHIHLAYSQVFHGMIMANAGSGISYRLKGEANSFNLIEAAADTVRIQRLTFDGRGFVSGTFQRFGRSPDGFVEIGLQTPSGAPAER